MKAFIAVFAVAALQFVPISVQASEITSFKLNDGMAAITIVGEIKPSDARKFNLEAAKHERAIVLLESDGGSLGAALEIGETIRLKGFTTAVINNSTCNSACGLIWLAGSPRSLSKSGRVGFHAAYSDATGKMTESGVANAMVGRYLTLLNMPARAVIFATTASPTELNWLTSSNYRSLGIDVVVIDDIDLDAPVSQANPSSSAETRLWRNLGVWSVFVDNTLDQGCFLAAKFTNNSLFRVGIDGTRTNQYYVLLGNPAWKSLDKGDTYNLRFQFDSESPWDVPVTAVDMDGSILLMSTFSDVDFWEEFISSQTLVVTRDDRHVTALSMAGTAAAFDELIDCQTAQNQKKLKRDPFER